MKVRTGFVSNSSSSSYVCSVCGEIACGFDTDLADWDMYQCEEGHVFCESHMENPVLAYEDMTLEQKTEYCREHAPEYCKEEVEEALAEGDEDRLDELQCDFSDRYEMPASLCPVCTLTSPSDADMLNYLLYCTGKDRESVAKTMKKEYGTLKEMEKHHSLFSV